MFPSIGNLTRHFDEILSVLDEFLPCNCPCPVHWYLPVFTQRNCCFRRNEVPSLKNHIIVRNLSAGSFGIVRRYRFKTLRTENRRPKLYAPLDVPGHEISIH